MTIAITREELATLLWNYAKFAGYDVDEADAMTWAVENGILYGDGESLDPDGNATRAMVAAIMQRFCEKILK